ncbi:MAG: acetylxylan esterase [Bryobacter sp.]|nr:acetylxylan esterase [Bryobacter sp.]
MLAPLLLFFAFQSPDTDALRKWLDEEAAARFAERTRALAAIQRPADVAARAKTVKAQLPLKPIDTTAPLNAQVTRKLDRGAYTIENLTFESLPGYRVSANLYLPKRNGKVPAILGVAGHSNNGKASAIYQRAWLAFVRQGWAVLAYDPPGQGERLEYFDPGAQASKVGNGVPEHQVAGLQCFLTGRNLADYFVTDGRRALDYLLTRPEIDPARIGVAGNSGGGTQAAYLTAIEPRLRAAVSSCYMTSWQQLWADPGPQDAEQILPGFLARGLDFADFAYSFPQRPFLLTAAIQDFFPIVGARTAYAEMQRVSTVADFAPRAAYFEYDDKHGWSQPRREAAVRFFRRWFDGRETNSDETNISEAPSDTEEESTLYASPTGLVGGKTTADLNREYFASLRHLWTPPTRQRLLDALDLPAPAPFARRLYPASAATRTLIVVAATQANSPITAELRATGLAVEEVLVRGAGALQNASRQGSYSSDYQLAARAWLLGHSVPAIQTADLRSVVAERAREGYRIWLYASGHLAPAAIFTAALESSVERLALENALPSYASLVEAQLHSRQALAIVPGILEHFDLPEILSLSPAQVTWITPLSPNGKALLTPTAVRRGEGWPTAKVLPHWFPR